MLNSTEAVLKERPILFSGESILGILAERKWQTRRPVGTSGKCPYGIVGDRLWVREWWITEHHSCYGVPSWKFRAAVESGSEKLLYRAEHPHLSVYACWRNPLFMPRWASRLTLKITEIRREPLHAITPEDVLAEGCESNRWEKYAALWDRLNAKRGYDWESNPDVWVLEFKVV